MGPSDIEKADIVVGLPNLYRSDYSNLKSLLYLDSAQFYDIYHENETPAGGKVSCRFLDSTREYPMATPGNDVILGEKTSPNTEAIKTLKNWGFVGQRCRRKCLYFKCSVSKLYAQQNVELHIGIKLKSMKELSRAKLTSKTQLVLQSNASFIVQKYSLSKALKLNPKVNDQITETSARTDIYLLAAQYAANFWGFLT